MNKIVYPNEVAAVVVTYNRLELLKQVINGLLNQTLKPNKIIVVNNNSTDGTLNWLEAMSKEQPQITFITQENTGSSGGQYTGTKTAFEMGYEWIWIMDDDVVAANDCLENLMLYCKSDVVAAPLRIGNDGKIFVNDTAEINLKNPFKGMHKRFLSKSDYLQSKIIPVDVVTFEGPIFHYSMFEKAGFPDKKFFIYADDTEFSIRLGKYGIRFVIIQKSVLNRLLPVPSKIDFDDWKFYYIYRNHTAIDTLYGNLPVRLFRSLLRVLSRIPKCKKISQFKTLLRAFCDGYFYRSS